MNTHRPYGPYEKYIKRPLDCLLAAGALVVLSPVMGVIALLVKRKLGSPILFVQERPGRDEKIFKLYKFRSMTDERDENGELLPDEDRLPRFGQKLRSTSLDELPELLNIIKGDMAVVGPRPQLVRDMVFMSPEQRNRHSVRPGLTGLAQVRGRNAISWEGKLSTDLEYLDRITFLGDLKIIMKTVVCVVHREGISEVGFETAEDFGDYLLRTGHITKEEYQTKQEEAKSLLHRGGRE